MFLLQFKSLVPPTSNNFYKHVFPLSNSSLESSPLKKVAGIKRSFAIWLLSAVWEHAEEQQQHTHNGAADICFLKATANIFKLNLTPAHSTTSRFFLSKMLFKSHGTRLFMHASGSISEYLTGNQKLLRNAIELRFLGGVSKAQNTKMYIKQ